MSRESEQGLDELAVVPLVETHGGLVEHVEDTDQPAADLRREADPLGLPAGQRRGRAVEAQVVEPDIDEELQPGADLLHHLSRDHLLPRAQLEALEQVVRGPDRQRRQLGDAPAPDLDRKRLRAKPRPAAVRARAPRACSPRPARAPTRSPPRCGGAAATARRLRTVCRSCARCRTGCGTGRARAACRRRRGGSCAAAW